MLRFAIVVFAVLLAASFSQSVIGCAGPYSGKPQKLKKPRKKKKPEKTDEVADAKEAVLDDKCRANFFDDPTTRRKVRQGRSLARAAEGLLQEAEASEGAQRVSAVKDALSKLRSSLKADPYGPQATYNMAAAYALVGKKGCAIELLNRLQELTKMPAVESQAERTIGRALRDQRFELFRKDADAALGR